jgi:hypothetical protein
MLETIEDIYQAQTSQIFQIMVHAVSPLSAISFYFLDKEKEDSEFALKTEIHPFSDTEIVSVSEKMRKHLNARCKDLQEVNTDSTEGDNFLRYRVEFLHRTGRDFLMTKDVHNLLRSRAPAKFDARVSLCRVLLAQIKVFPLCHLPFYSLRHRSYTSLGLLVPEMIHCALEVEIYNGISEIALLDELDRALLVHPHSYHNHHTQIGEARDKT